MIVISAMILFKFLICKITFLMCSVSTQTANTTCGDWRLLQAPSSFVLIISHTQPHEKRNDLPTAGCYNFLLSLFLRVKRVNISTDGERSVKNTGTREKDIVYER